MVLSALYFIPPVIKEFLGENRWCLPPRHPLLWPDSFHSIAARKAISASLLPSLLLSRGALQPKSPSPCLPWGCRQLEKGCPHGMG